MPVNANEKRSKVMCATGEEKQWTRNVPYKNLTGSLTYLAVSIRRDIRYGVNALNQYKTNYGKMQWTTASKC